VSIDKDDLWGKLAGLPAWAGCGVIRRALTLWYVLDDDDVPAWAKAAVVAALAYLILPLDAVPDFLPGVGFTDDLAALAAAVAEVAAWVTPSVKRRVRRALPEFCDDDDA
jgi:uncharacterized membrane protein YkvA (DUF1232 family)